MRDLSDLEVKVIGECLRAAVEGPFFVWYRKVEEPDHPERDQAWKAKSPRHRVTTRERFERSGAEDWGEFQTIFGLTRDEVAEVAATWPAERGSEVTEVAVNNAMNNLLGYPHKCDHVWSDYMSVSRAELKTLFREWRRTGTRSGPPPDSQSAGEEYFHGLM